jgi:hypothetical protein
MILIRKPKPCFEAWQVCYQSLKIFRGEKKMSNNNKNDRNEARHLMASGMAMIAVSLLLGIFLVMMGCSGGHKKLPTDPVGSKPADSDTLTDRGTIGDVDEGQLTDTGIFRESALDPEYEWAIPYLVEIWQTQKDGQAGDSLGRALVAGVFDSETYEPIEGAFISVGSEGTFVGETDLGGLVGMMGDFYEIDPLLSPIPGTEVNLYITAGAAGYELESYNSLNKNTFVFFLDPLTPTAPATATVSGTVDFNTEDFHAEVYASNMVSFTDGILTPSGPGIEEDTYEIQVEAGTEGCIVWVKRDSITNEIQYFSFKELPPFGEDEMHDISGQFSATPEFSGGIIPPEPESLPVFPWTNYGALSLDYNGIVELVSGTVDEISSMTASMQFSGITNGVLSMTDIQLWDVKPGYEETYRHFGTTYLPHFYKYLPHSAMMVRVDVEYLDGSGTSAIVDLGNSLEGSGTISLVQPPTIETPLSGALGVGLTPNLAWLFYRSEMNSPGVMTIIDTVNGNRWKVHLTTFDTPESQLPILPVELSGMGLTEGNEVQALLELDYSVMSIMNINGTTFTMPHEAILPGSYSKVSTFTP